MSQMFSDDSLHIELAADQMEIDTLKEQSPLTSKVIQPLPLPLLL